MPYVVARFGLRCRRTGKILSGISSGKTSPISGTFTSLDCALLSPGRECTSISLVHLKKTDFVIVDAHCKWLEQIVSENGPQFISDEFADFMRLNGVRHTRSSPYHPSSNGTVERFVSTFKQTMKAGEEDDPSRHHRLGNFLLTYTGQLLISPPSGPLYTLL